MTCTPRGRGRCGSTASTYEEAGAARTERRRRRNGDQKPGAARPAAPRLLLPAAASGRTAPGCPGGPEGERARPPFPLRLSRLRGAVRRQGPVRRRGPSGGGGRLQELGLVDRHQLPAGRVRFQRHPVSGVEDGGRQAIGNGQDIPFLPALQAEKIQGVALHHRGADLPGCPR